MEWSVQDVLDRVPELGIPHFQRGMVWGEDTKAALLESLYYDTPCGSFVLWQPDDCTIHGVRIDAAATRPMRHLVIDGQQRIRSLHSVFGQAGGTRTWCLNLAALPEVAGQADPLQRQASLFVFAKDPVLRTDAERRSPSARNLLPLRAIEAAAFWTNPSLDPYRELTTLDPALVEKLYPSVYKGVVAIRSRRFFVSIQRDAALADMVNLYNRINSGGKRVEVEERAFARLVGLQPGTFRDLKAAFDAVHGPRDATPDVSAAKLERDQVLQRQKERAFGFKLFIRVFLQVCQHHLGFPQGRTEFSFELAEKASFIKAFGSLGPSDADALWTETIQVLGHVRSVLIKPLCADDLRFVPDASALMPAFQLLIHYPDLKDERYRPLLAALSLRLMLAELDSRRLLQLVAIAGDPNEVAFRAIPKMLKALKDRLTPSALSGRLQYANSIQSRYVLLLYWLQRSLRARDFQYEHVPQPNSLKGPELLLEERVEPEKQHLLPFIKAQKLYGGELRRASSHPVNSIGNLTYISRELNDFDGGLGEHFARLDLEPAGNLAAHLVGDRVLKEYESLRRRFEKEDVASASAGRESFERMVHRRRENIQAAFERWIADLDHAACEALGIGDLTELGQLAERDDRLEPAAPRYPRFETVAGAHVIRGLGYSNVEEDHLIELLALRAKPLKKNKKSWHDGGAPYRWQLTKHKKVWLKLEPPKAMLRFDASVPTEVRGNVCGLLGVAPSSESEVLLPSIPRFVELMAQIPEIDKVLAVQAKLE
jgi:hypothetical protein